MKSFAAKPCMIIGAILVVGLLFGATVADAGFIQPEDPGGGPPAEFPGLALKMNSHGHGPPDHVNPPGLKNAAGNYEYKGKGKQGAFDVDWTIEVDPDPFINIWVELENTEATTKDFTFITTLDIAPQLTGGIVTGGSLSGTLIDMTGDGAELSKISGVPMYMSRIDGSDYYPMDLPSVPVVAAAHGTAGVGPVDFGAPIPSIEEPTMDVLDTIEIEINASVSGYDRAFIVATFVVEPIPEPSTLALLSMGVFGLLLHARRRR